ncbi:MAG: Gfo/Idh/MocA family oxidoreductase [Saprospiraceae bacterium]|nr:Gfo/Idh/MocA family oxidoreductase [Saprospiraceae bacterium]
MYKIGVVGAGHLGKIHLNCIKNISSYHLVGFYDSNLENAKEIASKYDIKAFESLEELIENVDIVDVVTPTIYHFDVAASAIKANKHVFIEKPVTSTVEQAIILKKLAEEHDVKIQVGHVERFNPALKSIKDFELAPMFIEAHRLSAFNPRGTDVSVVLDLMIHDIDLVVSMVKSPLVEVTACGINIVSDTSDIANVRLTFENGCVANLTASRISLSQMRKMRIFQHNAYISLDFLDKKSQIISLTDNVEKDLYSIPIQLPKGEKFINIHQPEIPSINSIQEELQQFCYSIENQQNPIVTIDDAIKTLNIAYDIMKDIDNRIAKVK